MYKDLVTLLRKKYDKAPLVMAAADAIEELSREYESVAASLNESVELVRKLQQPRWVSVNERLPEEGEDVLCRLRNDAGEVCATVGCYRSTFKLWDLDAEWASSRHVTHWMPLPEMP